MRGIGVIVNVLTILAGTTIGLVFGGLIHERFRSISFKAIGLATFVIGMTMSIGGLGAMGKDRMGDYAPLVLVGALVVGALIGELAGIEAALERLGHRMQVMSARIPFLSRRKDGDEGGHRIVEGFVTASLLFCVGAMTILGSIQDGLGDPSLLYLKATLDGFAALALAAALGAGVGLSILPVLVIQGGIALGASAVQPFMTPAVIHAIQATGGALIVAIGLDILEIKRLPTGNMLPSVLVAGVAAYWLG